MIFTSFYQILVKSGDSVLGNNSFIKEQIQNERQTKKRQRPLFIWYHIIIFNHGT